MIVDSRWRESILPVACLVYYSVFNVGSMSFWNVCKSDYRVVHTFYKLYQQIALVTIPYSYEKFCIKVNYIFLGLWSRIWSRTTGRFEDKFIYNGFWLPFVLQYGFWTLPVRIFMLGLLLPWGHGVLQAPLLLTMFFVGVFNIYNTYFRHNQCCHFYMQRINAVISICRDIHKFLLHIQM
jgi:hypothetical protein